MGFVYVALSKLHYLVETCAYFSEVLICQPLERMR